MSLTVKEIRQRVAAAVEGVSGCTESRFAGELFGDDAQQLMNRVFAVDCPTSEVHPEEGRQRVQLGALVNTEVRVQVAHLFRGDGQIADTDSALDFEHTIIRAVLGVARSDLHIVLERMSRDLTDAAEFRILTLTFRAIHRLTLQ